MSERSAPARDTSAPDPVEAAALLALLTTPGASPTSVARAVTDAGSARRVLERDATDAQARLFEVGPQTTDHAPFLAQLDA